MKRDEVACIILYDKDKKVLLQHRTEDTDRLPGYWAFFGGMVEENETPKEAAMREVYEELNFISKNPEFVMKHEFEMWGKEIMKNVFIELCKSKRGLKLKEGQGWGWYDIEDTKKLKMIFHDRKVLERIKKVFTKKKIG